MELTVHDVLKFHRPDCAAYDHLLALGAGREPARDAVALLMWLQSAAYIADEAASRVPIMVRSRGDAERIVAEARAVLLGAGEAASLPTQAMASLCGADASRVRGILAHAPTNVVRSGVAEVVAGVGALVFDDRLRELMWRYEAAGGRGALPPELAAPYRSCSASETPEPQQQEEEDDGCSLFVTFSKGEQPPWTREEIEVCIAEYVALNLKAAVFSEQIPPTFIWQKRIFLEE